MGCIVLVPRRWEARLFRTGATCDRLARRARVLLTGKAADPEDHRRTSRFWCSSLPAYENRQRSLSSSGAPWHEVGRRPTKFSGCSPLGGISGVSLGIRVRHPGYGTPSVKTLIPTSTCVTCYMQNLGRVNESSLPGQPLGHLFCFSYLVRVWDRLYGSDISEYPLVCFQCMREGGQLRAIDQPDMKGGKR